MASARRPAAGARLMLITPDFPPARGGIQLMSQRFASALEFETRVLAPGAPGAEQFDREAGLAVTRVPARRLPGAARNALLDAAATAEALRFRPDITLAMHIVASPAAVAIRRALRAPVVQYFHAEEIRMRPRLAAFAASHADEVIAVSAYCAELIEGTGAHPASMRLIPPGVDIAEDTSPLPCERPTIVTVARLEERYKGHDVMIRALPLVLARVPDAQWVVIGEGSLRPGLEQLAGSHGVAGAVRFLGAVGDEERNAWLRRARLLAMPSRLPDGGFAGEGFGIVFLEAGAFGKPVVAGNVGGALDSVLDGETGLLVDPRDPVAVADAVTAVLLDDALAARLGAAGARRARSYAWPLIAARLQAVLEETLARSGGRRAPGKQ